MTLAAIAAATAVLLVAGVLLGPHLSTRRRNDLTMTPTLIESNKDKEHA